MSHPTSDAELDINSDVSLDNLPAELIKKSGLYVQNELFNLVCKEEEVSLDFEAAREMFGNQDRPALSDQDPELLGVKAARYPMTSSSGISKDSNSTWKTAWER
ncbi:hypothetical protein GE061_009480 [Apolygus lucorum]|uniref:Uncharacterized protein n=1 Tax=Apolygus lucorum TaxID=248454 RepID=A0A8S9Y0M1_APOLU|nr:hypothetical protein GE061_009480 [Apolygus lucorum]